MLDVFQLFISGMLLVVGLLLLRHVLVLNQNQHVLWRHLMPLSDDIAALKASIETYIADVNTAISNAIAGASTTSAETALIALKNEVDGAAAALATPTVATMDPAPAPVTPAPETGSTTAPPADTPPPVSP